MSNMITRSQGKVNNFSVLELIKTREDGRRYLLGQVQGGYTVATYFDNKWIYDTGMESWYQYSKGVWIKTSYDNAISFFNKTIHQSLNGMDGTHSWIDGIIKQASRHLSIEGVKDPDGDLLPFRNGVYSHSSKTLFPHSPDYHFRWQLPFDYNNESKCKPVIDWLYQACECNQDRVELLRAYLNAIVKGRVDLQKYIEITGMAGSGKGTFIRLAESLVGIDNVHATDLSRLTGSQARFETSNIYGKKLLIITDAESYASDTSVLKAITGGDTLPYEEKYKQSRSFRPTCMVVIASNQYMSTSDLSSGLARRRITLPFNNQPEVRRNLDKEFQEFLPGVMNWVLELSDSSVTSTLINHSKSTPSLLSTTQDQLVSTNNIASWANECLIHIPGCKSGCIGVIKFGPNKEILNTQSQLYPSYVSHCEERAVKPYSHVKFSKLLIEIFSSSSMLNLPGVEKVRTKSGIIISGIRLRTSSDEKIDLLITPIYPLEIDKDADVGLEGDLKTFSNENHIETFFPLKPTQPTPIDSNCNRISNIGSCSNLHQTYTGVGSNLHQSEKTTNNPIIYEAYKELVQVSPKSQISVEIAISSLESAYANKAAWLLLKMEELNLIKITDNSTIDFLRPISQSGELK